MNSKWFDSVGTVRKSLIDIEDEITEVEAESAVPLDFGNRFKNLENKIKNEIYEIEKISKNSPSPDLTGKKLTLILRKNKAGTSG